jgi:uncharacterized protein YndB with AHSA1/START domain
MSDIKIVEEYDRPVAVVWKVLTDPELVPLWTSTGQGGRPEGFRAEVGATFRFVGKPFPGWDGIVRCEVLVAEVPHRLSYTWRNKEADDPTVVSYLLDETPSGTRLTWSHIGFHGVEGFFMSRLLGRVRRKMLTDGIPAALSLLDDDGSLEPKAV